jgi:hypothetical protein
MPAIHLSPQKLMSDLPEKVRDQINVLQAELRELETSDDWRNSGGIHGSRRLRDLSKRLTQSAKRLEGLVKETTFSR